MQSVVNRNETSAYGGAKFWMYCGGRDMGHGYPMCDELKNARATIENYGGTVARLFEDPSGPWRTGQERGGLDRDVQLL